ncbi:MAG: NADH-quinone oxidoreductase subunit NuoF [Deltaproteobacteria bacterium]|nr:NADH-quinone oxidoreductase subunit NuoF [Deltaproteobacteria bacterium]
MAGERLLTRNWDTPDAVRLPVYEQRGGYKAARKALGMTPAEVIAEVKKANLRGRGGAGFPAGVKWGFINAAAPTKYLVINADEGEPGTFKDRVLMERDPHQLVEGCIIASYAIGAHHCYIYIRGELPKAAKTLTGAIAEARAHGYLGKSCFGRPFELELTVHRGAGAYICGEETALLESLEGKRGEPRLKPPFPAVVGAFGQPTIVNNVETISAVTHVLERGGDAFTALGLPGDGGTRIFCLSGHVKKPGLYELPVGTPLRTLIYEHGGGIREDRALKAVIPGGSSTPVLLPEHLDAPLSVDGLKAVGSMIGSAAVIVMDETTCVVRAMWRLARFYHHESCGQCTPCREGTGWLERVLWRIETGVGRDGDVDLLKSIAENMMGNTICPLGDAAAMPTLGFLNRFRTEFEQHVLQGKCPFGGRFALPAGWQA